MDCGLCSAAAVNENRYVSEAQNHGLKKILIFQKSKNQNLKLTLIQSF